MGKLEQGRAITEYPYDIHGELLNPYRSSIGTVKYTISLASPYRIYPYSYPSCAAFEFKNLLRFN
jgi:hypothetical protein